MAEMLPKPTWLDDDALLAAAEQKGLLHHDEAGFCRGMRRNWAAFSRSLNARLVARQIARLQEIGRKIGQEAWCAGQLPEAYQRLSQPRPIRHRRPTRPDPQLPLFGE